ncbi:MAG: AI-2E family transporter [Actinomycetota bacterium]
MASAIKERPTNATVARIVVVVAAVSLLLYALYRVRSVLVLVLVAAFLAVGLDPAVRRLERFKLKRGQAVAVIFLTLTAVVIGFALAVVPPLVSQVSTFATDLPDYVSDLGSSHPRINDWLVENDIPQKLEDATKNVPSLIGGSFGSVLGVAGSVMSAIFNGITILVLTIYFTMSLSRIRDGSLKLVPKSRRARVGELADPILEKIGGYIAGQITVASIAAVLSLIFLTVAGVPFPIALSLWVLLAALIPLVGATLGAIPAVIVAFFASTGLGVGTLVFFLIYQQVENYIIAPRVMTKAVDISPAAVLLAALIGGTLLGFVGALMAIPAAAAIKLIMQQVVLPKAEAA